MADKEVKQEEKKAPAKKVKKKEPVKYIHIDEFFANREEQLSSNIKNGFRVFMKGATYQLSHDKFERELKKFFKRKI